MRARNWGQEGIGYSVNKDFYIAHAFMLFRGKSSYHGFAELISGGSMSRGMMKAECLGSSMNLSDGERVMVVEVG